MKFYKKTTTMLLVLILPCLFLTCCGKDNGSLDVDSLPTASLVDYRILHGYNTSVYESQEEVNADGEITYENVVTDRIITNEEPMFIEDKTDIPTFNPLWEDNATQITNSVEEKENSVSFVTKEPETIYTPEGLTIPPNQGEGFELWSFNYIDEESSVTDYSSTASKITWEIIDGNVDSAFVIDDNILKTNTTNFEQETYTLTVQGNESGILAKKDFSTTFTISIDDSVQKLTSPWTNGIYKCNSTRDDLFSVQAIIDIEDEIDITPEAFDKYKTKFDLRVFGTFGLADHQSPSKVELNSNKKAYYYDEDTLNLKMIDTITSTQLIYDHKETIANSFIYFPEFYYNGNTLTDVLVSTSQFSLNDANVLEGKFYDHKNSVTNLITHSYLCMITQEANANANIFLLNGQMYSIQWPTDVNYRIEFK